MNSYKIADKIIKGFTAYKAYYQALNGINIKENEKIVLEIKDTNWCYQFAKNIPAADIKAHEKNLLELKDAYYCFIFARDVPEANIEEHFKIIFNSEDKHWLNKFIQEVNYKGTKVEEWLFYI